MEITTAMVVAVVLLVGLWVPYCVWYIRRGEAQGHTWFNWWKPRGHPTPSRKTLAGPSRLALAPTTAGVLVTEIAPSWRSGDTRRSDGSRASA